LLAPLGWLSLTALSHEASCGLQIPPAAEALRLLETDSDAACWQRELWGMDHTAIARRLARLWRLPAWLTPIIGHLGLHVRIADRLGAEPQLFQLVQLAVALLQERDRGLALPVGATVAELAGSLGLPAAELDAAAERAWQTPAELPAAEPPVMMPDLLRLAIEQ